MPTAKGWGQGQAPQHIQGGHLRPISSIPAVESCRTATCLSPRRGAADREPLGLRSVGGHGIETGRRCRPQTPTASRFSATPSGDRRFAEVRNTFLQGLNQPFGWRSWAKRFTSATRQRGWVPLSGRDRIAASAVQAHRFQDRADGRAAPEEASSADCSSNIGENGMAIEEGRAAARGIVWRAAGAASRRGPAQPVGTPRGRDRRSGRWSTSARPGRRDPSRLRHLGATESTGWPYCGGGRWTTAWLKNPEAVAKAKSPTTRSAGTPRRSASAAPAAFPGFRGHGHRAVWNRSTLSGYEVAFAPFDGRPAGACARHSDRVPRRTKRLWQPVGVTLGPTAALC